MAGRRIADLKVRSKPIDPNRKYKVDGWASGQGHPADTHPICRRE
jgi:hypothetical protein